MATGGNGISKDMAARLTAVAHDLADVARIETLKLFRSPDLRPDNKAAAGFDPVTAADRASERAMREIHDFDMRPVSKRKLLRDNALRIFRLPDGASPQDASP